MKPWGIALLMSFSAPGLDYVCGANIIAGKLWSENSDQLEGDTISSAKHQLRRARQLVPLTMDMSGIPPLCRNGFIFMEGQGCVRQSPCRQGYLYEPINSICKDVNECTVPVDMICGKNFVCTNTPGSFTCACRTGFSLQNKKCVRLRRRCKKGYIYSIQYKKCLDFDECDPAASKKYRCSRYGTCENTVGSFMCKCKNDYFGNGKVCLPSPAVQVQANVTTRIQVPIRSQTTPNWSKIVGSQISWKVVEETQSKVKTKIKTLQTVSPLKQSLETIFSSVTATKDPLKTSQILPQISALQTSTVITTMKQLKSSTPVLSLPIPTSPQITTTSVKATTAESISPIPSIQTPIINITIDPIPPSLSSPPPQTLNQNKISTATVTNDSSLTRIATTSPSGSMQQENVTSEKPTPTILPSSLQLQSTNISNISLITSGFDSSVNKTTTISSSQLIQEENSTIFRNTTLTILPSSSRLQSTSASIVGLTTSSEQQSTNGSLIHPTPTSTTVRETKNITLAPKSTLSPIKTTTDNTKQVISTLERSTETVKPTLILTPDNITSVASFGNNDPCYKLQDPKTGKLIRREWRELTQLQKQTFIDAIRELVKRGTHRDVVALHEPAFIKAKGHVANAFFHWHRAFISLYEQQLRSTGHKYRCITLPYWDWSLDIREDIYAIPLISVVEELGGVSKNCITHFGNISYNDNTCLTRPFGHRRGWRPPGPIELANAIISKPRFNPLQTLLKGWHGLVHNKVGGTMRDITFSPNDPIFFLHHAFMDKLFATWQECHGRSADPGPFAPASMYIPNYKVKFPHGFDDPLVNLPTNITPRMINDINKLNYTYSGDEMDGGVQWAPLQACKYLIPWASQPKNNTEPNLNNTTTKASTKRVARVRRRTNRKGVKSKDRSKSLAKNRVKSKEKQANETNESNEYPELVSLSVLEDEINLRTHISKVCRAFLVRAYSPSKSFRDIVSDAAKMECKVFSHYGPLDPDLKNWLGLEDLVMPCE